MAVLLLQRIRVAVHSFVMTILAGLKITQYSRKLNLVVKNIRVGSYDELENASLSVEKVFLLYM